jgi:hypothetical protein
MILKNHFFRFGFLYKCKFKFKYLLKGMCEDHFDKRSLDLIDFEEKNND